MKKTSVVLVVIVVLAVMLTVQTQLDAAPLASTSGPTPLYDSGWVLTTSGTQTFTHDLHERPTLWGLYAADDGDGMAPANALLYERMGASDKYGGIVGLLGCTEVQVAWQEDGIAWSTTQSKWYQRGTDYARLVPHL